MLVNRQQFLSTRVLPVGLWTVGVAHGRWSSTAGSYNNQGSQVSNSNYFSRDVDYGALSDEISDPLERELARAAFNVYDRADSTVAGRAVNDVSVDQQSNTYVLGRGISERSSMFIAVPVITLRTKIRSRFVPSASLNSLADQLRTEGQYSQAEQIIEDTRNALRERLQDTGYAADYPSELTTVANVFLTHRYQGNPGSRWDYSADSSLVVPAGKRSDQDDFLYLRLNEEQFSVREALTLAFRATPQFELLLSSYYHLRFPFEKDRRIPMNDTSPLSADVDSATQTRYGNSWGASTQANYVPSDSWLVYLGHSREVKERDRVSGSRFASARYDYLEQNTEQSLSTTYAGFSVNTIQRFLAQKFPAPVDLNLQYSLTTAGRNAFANQAIAATLMVFYK